MSVTRTAAASFLAVVVLAGLMPGVASAQTPDPYYDFLMARRFESQGNTQAALSALLRAEAADPTSAEIKAEIAAFHLRRTPPDRDAGEKAGKAALEIDGKNVEANRTLGYLYAGRVDGTDRPLTVQMAEDVRRAIQHLEVAIAGTPGTDANLQYMLGRLYQRNGESAKAVQAFARVVAQNPNSVQGLRSLAEAHASGGDLKSAIATLEEVVDFLPGVARMLAEYQDKAGLFKEAVETYTMAIAVEPNNRELKVRRVVALFSAKDFARAAAFASEGRKQHPDDPRFPRLQGRALFDSGDRTGGIAIIESLARSAPKDTAVQWTLVDMYSTTGRDADLERTLRQILDAEPSEKNALNHLGYLLAVRGERLDEAITLVRRALDQDPNNGAYLDSLGWAHFRRGDLPEAEKYLSAAAEQLPRNSEVLDHLGDVHARRGNLQGAITAWTRALSGDGADVDRAAIERKLEEARKKLTR
jgi:tetratricopeptide (TPR) repeat protein